MIPWETGEEEVEVEEELINERTYFSYHIFEVCALRTNNKAIIVIFDALKYQISNNKICNNLWSLERSQLTIYRANHS